MQTEHKDSQSRWRSICFVFWILARCSRREVRNNIQAHSQSIQAMAKLASSTTTTQTIAWQRPHQQRTLASSEWLSLKEAAKVRKNGSNKADVPRDVLLELELSRPLLALRKSVAEEAAAKGVVWALKAERSPSYL